jgi:phosphoribosylanthranilate isomerase
MSIRVQIYTAQTTDEALGLAALGVDHVGLTPSDLGLPGEIGIPRARAIRDALVGHARSVALSVATDLPAIIEMVGAVRPDIVHLCGPPGAVGPGDVATLRHQVGTAAIMQAVAVTGPEAVDVARAFAPVVDYLLLDSVAPHIPGVGAAGTTHDWSVSAEIVEAVDVPVILAGGLSPANVAAAVTRVRPWGVDSLTHTNRTMASGGFWKDLDLVEAFVTAAREAHQQ